MSELVIRIDRNRCNGCGDCITACSEDVLALEGGKAVLISEDYCDGFGLCLPACPAGALFLEARPHNCRR